MPCAPPICATQMRSATAGYPEADFLILRMSLSENRFPLFRDMR
jgi:hypothetical protein